MSILEKAIKENSQIDPGKNMAISMTGFGAAEFEWDAWSCQVEIRAVNQRFLDVKCRLPLGFQKLESDIKKQIKLTCSRGKIDCFIRLEKTIESEGMQINHDRAKQFSDILKEFEGLSGININLEARSLASMNVIEDNKKADHPVECEKLIKKTLLKALKELKKMKISEGEAMQKDIIVRLSLCGELIQSIEKLSLEEPRLYKERLYARLSDLNLDSKINPERLEQEIVLYAEKLDISEELLRFKTHLKHMDEIFSQREVGKKAEFLIQELNREVNTISSKSNQAEISQGTVEIKSELEKIREQLQNIE